MSKRSTLTALLGGLAFLLLFAGQSQAYICSGNGNEFDTDDCTEAEIAGLYGISDLDDFVELSKDDLPDTGTDDVAEVTNTAELIVTKPWDPSTGITKFTFEWDEGTTPLVIVTKYDNMYSVFDWETQVEKTGDEVNSVTEYQVIRPGVDEHSTFQGYVENGNSPDEGTFACATTGSPNCTAGDSHVSAYGLVPIPAAVWLFGSAIVGMVGVGYRRRPTA